MATPASTGTTPTAHAMHALRRCTMHDASPFSLRSGRVHRCVCCGCCRYEFVVGMLVKLGKLSASDVYRRRASKTRSPHALLNDLRSSLCGGRDALEAQFAALPWTRTSRGEPSEPQGPSQRYFKPETEDVVESSHVTYLTAAPLGFTSSHAYSGHRIHPL
jgi:hypothetical protein